MIRSVSAKEWISTKSMPLRTSPVLWLRSNQSDRKRNLIQSWMHSLRKCNFSMARKYFELETHWYNDVWTRITLYLIAITNNWCSPAKDRKRFQIEKHDCTFRWQSTQRCSFRKRRCKSLTHENDHWYSLTLPLVFNDSHEHFCTDRGLADSKASTRKAEREVRNTYTTVCHIPLAFLRNERLLGRFELELLCEDASELREVSRSAVMFCDNEVPVWERETQGTESST